MLYDVLWDEVILQISIKYRGGSQPFGTRVPPNQNCNPLCTPKSEFSPLHVPTYQKVYPNELLLSGFKLLHSPCELLLSVESSSCTLRGECTPGWEPLK
jgi:hypothetical protein